MARATVTSAAPVALICGDDDFAVKARARELFDQWSRELGGTDHEIVDGQVTHSGDALKALGRLREALQTLPFFGDGKTVWLKNCSFLGEERTASVHAVTESLAELSQELKQFSWGKVRLLISAGKVDKRKTFYKTLEKLGTVEAFEALSIDDQDWASAAESWVLRAVRQRKKQITDDALAEVVNRIGPSHRQLESEIDKLTLYVDARPEVTLEDVKAIATRNKQARAFALADAVGDRDLPRVLRTLDEELWEMKSDSQKSAIGLLYGLISKIRAMILLKEMMREGWLKPEANYARFKAQLERIPPGQFPEDKRFNPMTMHPYMLHKALQQAGRYSVQELIAAMSLLLECNQRLIFSNLDDALVLQQTLVQIIRGDTSRVKNQT